MTFRRIILGLFLFQCASYAQYPGECVVFSDPNDYIDDPYVLDNGLFECGDPNLTEYGFKPPIYWERIPHPDSIEKSDCYAALHPSFNPNEPSVEMNNTVIWSIPAPYEGETFVLLSTGGFGGIEDREIKGAKIGQKVLLNEGDVILGAYFLGTTDYPNYNDYGRIFAQLEPNYVCPCPDPNELVTNGGFDSDTSWTKTGLWTITDPNISDPNFPDPNLPDPNFAVYNLHSQPIDPNVDSILSQTIPFVPQANYRVSIDVLTGEFDSGNDAFMVTLGDETYNMTAYANTTITQLFTPTSGNTLTISWNNEGTINIDNVSVRCSDQCPVDEFEIILEALGEEPNDIPAYGSTDGWVEFEYIIDEPNKAGPYLLQCEVIDYRDDVVATYLAVDGLRICRGGKPISDLNNDCDVNLFDYSILSEAWLSFCPDIFDPNIMDSNDIADDNIPCELADIDNSWFVEPVEPNDLMFVSVGPNDLMIMSNEWLLTASDPNSS